MKTLLAITGAALALAAAQPAAAEIVQVRYDGTVTAVFGLDPEGVAFGDVAHVRVRYDPSLITEVTAETNAIFGTSYGKFQVATLSGPGAGVEVDLAGHHWDKNDQFDFFPDPYGEGRPYVLFKDGAFFGVDFFGLQFGTSAFVTAGPAPEFFDFVGGSFKVPGPSYGGYFDYGHAKFDGAVPEPASWALMLMGFGGLGAMLRRRRRAALAA
jgi:hypothetical protein